MPNLPPPIPEVVSDPRWQQQDYASRMEMLRSWENDFNAVTVEYPDQFTQGQISNIREVLDNQRKDETYMYERDGVGQKALDKDINILNVEDAAMYKAIPPDVAGIQAEMIARGDMAEVGRGLRPGARKMLANMRLAKWMAAYYDDKMDTPEEARVLLDQIDNGQGAFHFLDLSQKKELKSQAKELIRKDDLPLVIESQLSRGVDVLDKIKIKPKADGLPGPIDQVQLDEKGSAILKSILAAMPVSAAPLEFDTEEFVPDYSELDKIEDPKLINQQIEAIESGIHPSTKDYTEGVRKRLVSWLERYMANRVERGVDRIPTSSSKKKVTIQNLK